MHEHPNDCHFTTPTLVMGQRLSVPATKQFEFSSDEKNADVLASCVRAASLAVDEARAALTDALAGTDAGLIDHAARAYKEAARLFLAAQRERYHVRLAQVGTPEWAQEQRGQREVREDLINALAEAERRGQLEGSAADVLADLDAWLDFRDDDDFLPPPPAHSQRNAALSGSAEMRGDLR